MRRILPAVALVLMVSPAGVEAASLVTSPLIGYDAGGVHCAIQYIGTSTVPIPIQLTAKQGNVVIRQERIARLSVTQPAYAMSIECPGAGNECYNAICVFSFTGDKTLFRASACLTSDLYANNGAQLCMPAY